MRALPYYVIELTQSPLDSESRIDNEKVPKREIERNNNIKGTDQGGDPKCDPYGCAGQ